LLTRGKDETYFGFIHRILASGNEVAIGVKIADIRDNLRDLEEGHLKDKYRFALFLLERRETPPENEVPSAGMMTAILINEAAESHVRRYPVEDVRAARDCIMRDWIDGLIQWKHFEYYGKNCTVETPAFSPGFLQQHGYEDEPRPIVEDGVTIYTWFCATGPHGSDEHCVTGYFVPSRDEKDDRSGRLPCT
jgi:hypothetical protein